MYVLQPIHQSNIGTHVIRSKQNVELRTDTGVYNHAGVCSFCSTANAMSAHQRAGPPRTRTRHD